MKTEVLVALLVKQIEERFKALSESPTIRGPKGKSGRPGRDGKDFVFSEHEETLRSWAKEFALKFSDLSEEEIAALRGPPGRDGRDGKDFNFEENREATIQLVYQVVSENRESLRLKLDDLTSEEIERLRGPRGRDGRDGRDGKGFDFEEHRTFFEGLKPKFSDFTPEEVEQLRPNFSELSDEHRNLLKFRFEDLTEEERQQLRGARGAKGQRGKAGLPGRDGKDGKDGRDGSQGPAGRDGKDGRDGHEAPSIVDIRLEQIGSDEISFVFNFSNGASLETNSIKLPTTSLWRR